jgi:hypothetical protein
MAPLRSSMSRAVGVRLAQVAEPAQQLLPGREAPWHEPCLALCRVPTAEVLDHRLRMHGRLGVRCELPHRRRAPKALGAGRELREDLLVRVALADTRLERRQRFRIDACHRRVAAGPSHAISVEHFR